MEEAGVLAITAVSVSGRSVPLVVEAVPAVADLVPILVILRAQAPQKDPVILRARAPQRDPTILKKMANLQGDQLHLALQRLLLRIAQCYVEHRLERLLNPLLNLVLQAVIQL